MFEKHIDQRGYFQELYKQSMSAHTFDIKQISVCSINPGETRGGHYHKKLNEGFIVIEGEMMVTLQHCNDPEDLEHWMLMEGQLMFMPQHYIHTVCSAIPDQGCKFIVITDKEFDPDNPDTYRKNEG
jgi:dTDP-4-dehydrorhamnose 3,5-epimerase-like enzyme